jgi:hypothetical protein
MGCGRKTPIEIPDVVDGYDLRPLPSNPEEVIVVATGDFELYHDIVVELRARDVTFTTIAADDPLPESATVVISAPSDGRSIPESAGIEHVVVGPSAAREAVERALGLLRGDEGRLVVGVDPGDRPGIAVCRGGRVVSVFQVPLVDAVAIVRREIDGEPDALVRVGDGARLEGARIINELGDVPIELVDETATTPYLGEGARGMGDVLAAVNIAHLEGERIEQREVEPTPGELQRIQTQSREVSEGGRTISTDLARRVATGELTVEEALERHENGEETDSEEANGEADPDGERSADDAGDADDGDAEATEE